MRDLFTSEFSAYLSFEAHFEFVCIFNKCIAGWSISNNTDCLSLAVYGNNYSSNPYSVNQRLLEDLFLAFVWINTFNLCFLVFSTTSPSKGGIITPATQCGTMCLWLSHYVSIDPRSYVERSLTKISRTWATGHRFRSMTSRFEACNMQNVMVNWCSRFTELSGPETP